MGTVTGKFNGAVEVGVTRFGGVDGSKRVSKKQNAGRGQVGKSAIVGIERPALPFKHVADRDAAILPSLVHERTKPDTLASTDDA